MDNAGHPRTDSGIVSPMRRPPAIAAQQFGTFTTSQAVAAGWTSHALRHAAAVGTLVRLRTGIYAAPVTFTGRPYADDAARLVQHAAAASIADRRVPVSHHGAAALFGLPLVAVPRMPCMTVPPRWRTDIAGVHLHHDGCTPAMSSGSAAFTSRLPSERSSTSVARRAPTMPLPPPIVRLHRV